MHAGVRTVIGADLRELHQLLGTTDRKLPDQDVIEHGKHGSVGADSERQGEDRYGGEDGRLRQGPDGVSQFTGDIHTL